jgi:MazG family protein
MRRRHPHVFGEAQIANAAEQIRAWEDQKARERAEGGQGSGSLDGIPGSLPSLMRAAKLGRRAARTGFDWPDWKGARAKIDEELRELDEEISRPRDRARLEHEVGDLLFAVVNLARHLDIDPEAALQASNGRFTRRFREMERSAQARGTRLEELDAEALDRLWNQAKAAGL